MVIRRIIVLTLLGLLVGAGLGVGFVIWRKNGFPVPKYGTLAPAQITGLTATCSGGSSPRVLVTWNAALDPFSAGLERSSGGSAWQSVVVHRTLSGQPHTVDMSVQPNTLYLYRIVQNGSQVSNIAEVTTSAEACAAH